MWRHTESGQLYIVEGLCNLHSNDVEKFPVTVVYLDPHGHTWSRPVNDFIAKFTESGYLVGG